MSKVMIVCMVLASGSAFAQEHDPDMQGPPTQAPERTGPSVTLAFGPGELHLIPDSGSETRIEGAAFTLRAGTALSPTSAVEAMIDFVNGSGTQSTVMGGDVKFYTTPDLYVRLGGGVGVASMPGMMGTDRHWGVAAVVGIGYEWFQLRDLALFGELEGTANRLAESGANTTVVNAALNFGICWF